MERHLGAVGRALQLVDVLRVVVLDGGQCLLVGAPARLRLVEWQVLLVERARGGHEAVNDAAERPPLRRDETKPLISHAVTPSAGHKRQILPPYSTYNSVCDFVCTKWS